MCVNYWICGVYHFLAMKHVTEIKNNDFHICGIIMMGLFLVTNTMYKCNCTLLITAKGLTNIKY